MPLISACCCWEELRTGSRASAWFTGITAVINLIIDLWLIVRLHWLDNNLEAHEVVNFLPPGIIAFAYIELLCNLLLLALAFVLMIGINRQHEGYRFIYGWVWGVSIFRAYQVFLGIYTLSFLGAHRITDIIYMASDFLFVVVYWFLDTIILIAAIICVMSYWTELMDEVYGKFRRVKYFTMLGNLRNAALQSHSMSGAATPRSYYSRSVGSTLNMAPSQISMEGRQAPGAGYASGNPYKHHAIPPHMQQHHPHAYQGPYRQQHPPQQGQPQAGPLPPKY